MSGAVLESTVAHYNLFVDSGNDAVSDKPTPKYKIQTPAFYAAWAMPVIHDTRAGLRINGKCQVIDFSGNVIPGSIAQVDSAFMAWRAASCRAASRAGMRPPRRRRTFERQ